MEKGSANGHSLFMQRPDLRAPIIDFAILRPELVTPGYIFLAPYRNLDHGPYIYDNHGNLVWSGAGASGPKTAHAPRVCQYKGADHLCFFEGEQYQGFARGHGVIMDQSYRVVKTIESAGASASGDMHEFRITPYSNATTALMTVYQPRPYDFTTSSTFNLQHGLGWIVEGIFQEIDIETGRLVFEWRSLDHVDPSEAWILPGSTDTSGDGLHEQSPWDYFHINSVDKNEQGDYLISARHVSAIYKVSGQDGHILWQLGGNRPTFEQTNFQFSYQHHARWISENDTHTTFSFYDNASNGYEGTGEFSHGWIIAVDHIANTATMVQEWGAPEPAGGLLSTSQGNLQLLPNGGCHIGWGEYAYFSEHLADGTCVQYAKAADRASDVMIYRSHKYNWTAQPVTKPALWTFSRHGDGYGGGGGAAAPAKQAPVTGFWVSWNGATEVRGWNFYVAERASGPFVSVGSARKTGFETEFFLPQFWPWAFAEAVDAHDTPLERSVIARTFVPGDRLRPLCDDRGCPYAQPIMTDTITTTTTTATFEVADSPIEDEQFLSPGRGFNTSHYYEDLPPVDDSGAGLLLPNAIPTGHAGTAEVETGMLGTGVMLSFAVVLLLCFAWFLSRLRQLRARSALHQHHHHGLVVPTAATAVGKGLGNEPRC